LPEVDEQGKSDDRTGARKTALASAATIRSDDYKTSTPAGCEGRRFIWISTLDADFAVIALEEVDGAWPGDRIFPSVPSHQKTAFREWDNDVDWTVVMPSSASLACSPTCLLDTRLCYDSRADDSFVGLESGAELRGCEVADGSTV
jgi:hypothetical protein